MSNTYFKLNKSKKDTFNQKVIESDGDLSLTAFMGGEDKVQLTVNQKITKSNKKTKEQHTEYQIAYITLSNDDIDKLIYALMERKMHKITATGYEKSDMVSDEEYNNY